MNGLKGKIVNREFPNELKYGTDFKQIPVDVQLAGIMDKYSRYKFKGLPKLLELKKLINVKNRVKAAKDILKNMTGDLQELIMRLARIFCWIMYVKPSANPWTYFPNKRAPVLLLAATLVSQLKDARFFRPFMTLEEMTQNTYPETDSDMTHALDDVFDYEMDIIAIMASFVKRHIRPPSTETVIRKPRPKGGIEKKSMARRRTTNVSTYMLRVAGMPPAIAAH